MSFGCISDEDSSNGGSRLGKRGYVATLEAFIAFFITFSFVIFVVHEVATSKALNTPEHILPTLENDQDFRRCVYSGDTGCLDDMVSPYIPAVYDSKVTINEIAPLQAPDDVHTESIMMASNTSGEYKIVKLYYWQI
jgi:hypothetical protein